MEDIVLGGRLWRAYVSEVEQGLLLKGDAREFDQLFLRVNQELKMQRHWDEYEIRISAIIRCPAGEPEAWVWIKRLAPPRKIRATMAMQSGRMKAW